jgi:hypothetical protein
MLPYEQQTCTDKKETNDNIFTFRNHGRHPMLNGSS